MNYDYGNNGPQSLVIYTGLVSFSRIHGFFEWRPVGGVQETITKIPKHLLPVHIRFPVNRVFRPENLLSVKRSRVYTKDRDRADDPGGYVLLFSPWLKKNAHVVCSVIVIFFRSHYRHRGKVCNNRFQKWS